MDEYTQLSIRMEAVRDQLLAVIRQHEDEEHGGEKCPETRLNAIAFFASCLEMNTRTETLRELRKRIRQCERDNRDIPQEGDGHED